jgi:hypothetical protein
MAEKYFTFFDEAPHVIIGDEVDDSCGVDDTLIKFSIFLPKKTYQLRRLVK